MRKLARWGLVLTFLVLVSNAAWSAGLTANFGEVVVDGLRIGYPFSMSERAHLPYIVSNPGLEEIDVKIEVKAPPADKVKKGYEPIPDVSWVKLEKNSFLIKPYGSVSTDVILDIPKDKNLIGRKFEVSLFPYTLQGILRIQVQSNILFTVSNLTEAYPTFLGSKQLKGMATFELAPAEIRLDGAALGAKVAVGQALKITNTTGQTCNFYLNTIPFKGYNAETKAGFQETPNPKFLSFSEDIVTLKPNESKEVKLYVNFPKDKQYAGKNYEFLIAVVLGEQEVPMIKYAFLLTTTKN